MVTGYDEGELSFVQILKRMIKNSTRNIKAVHLVVLNVPCSMLLILY